MKLLQCMVEGVSARACIKRLWSRVCEGERVDTWVTGVMGISTKRSCW